MVARYAPNLAAFEVWNEPDQANEIYWAGPNKIRGYVALAKAVYPALKQVAPSVPVLAGSFVGGNGKWLQALYNAGLKGSYDGLAVHFYDLPLSALTITRAVQKRNGDRKPLWLSEFGFTSCYAKGGAAFKIDHACNTRKGQAQNLTDTLRKVASVSWIKSAIVYMINDQSDAYQFGLLTASGQSKPAFAAVRDVFAGKKVRVTKPKMSPLKATRGRVVVKGTATQTETSSCASGAPAGWSTARRCAPTASAPIASCCRRRSAPRSCGSGWRARGPAASRAAASAPLHQTSAGS